MMGGGGGGGKKKKKRGGFCFGGGGGGGGGGGMVLEYHAGIRCIVQPWTTRSRTFWRYDSCSASVDNAIPWGKCCLAVDCIPV